MHSSEIAQLTPPPWILLLCLTRYRKNGDTQRTKQWDFQRKAQIHWRKLKGIHVLGSTVILEHIE